MVARCFLASILKIFEREQVFHAFTARSVEANDGTADCNVDVPVEESGYDERSMICLQESVSGESFSR